jgi:hypothetical protein
MIPIFKYKKNFDIMKFTIYLLYNIVRSEVRKTAYTK